MGKEELFLNKVIKRINIWNQINGGAAADGFLYTFTSLHLLTLRDLQRPNEMISSPLNYFYSSSRLEHEVSYLQK